MILERFDMRRTCQDLREKGYQLTSVSGDHSRVRLHFMKISEQKMLLNPIWNLGFWGLPSKISRQKEMDKETE